MTTHIFKNPEHYSNNNALQYHVAMDMLNKISFNSGAKLLEIGCGDGMITNEIAKIISDGYVVGTDISGQMIDHATKSYCNQGNLSFIQMDATKNMFHQQFDVVTSFNCLH